MERDDEVILRVAASPVRRWLAIGAMFVLAGLLFWVALQGSAPVFWALVLILGGGVSFWGALRLKSATEVALELTRDGIRTDAGDYLVRVGDIDRIDRGAFAFKPSNGFLVRLKTPTTRGWAPGVWWRAGTFLGIGGTLPPGQTRAMADLLKAVEAGDLP